MLKYFVLVAKNDANVHTATAPHTYQGMREIAAQWAFWESNGATCDVHVVYSSGDEPPKASDAVSNEHRTGSIPLAAWFDNDRNEATDNV